MTPHHLWSSVHVLWCHHIVTTGPEITLLPLLHCCICYSLGCRDDITLDITTIVVCLYACSNLRITGQIFIKFSAVIIPLVPSVKSQLKFPSVINIRVMDCHICEVGGWWCRDSPRLLDDVISCENVIHHLTWWCQHIRWHMCMKCGIKNTFGILVYSREYIPNLLYYFHG
jgi:hypothetical protein